MVSSTFLVETFLHPDAIGISQMTWDTEPHMHSALWDQIKDWVKEICPSLGIDFKFLDKLGSKPKIIEELLKIENPFIHDFVLHRAIDDMYIDKNGDIRGFAGDQETEGFVGWVMHREYTEPRGPIAYCKENHWGVCMVCQGPQGLFLRVPTTEREELLARTICRGVVFNDRYYCPRIRGDKVIIPEAADYPSVLREQEEIFEAKTMKAFAESGMTVTDFRNAFNEGSLSNFYLNLFELSQVVGHWVRPDSIREGTFEQNMAPVSLEERQKLRAKGEIISQRREVGKMLSRLRRRKEKEEQMLEEKSFKGELSPYEESQIRARIDLLQEEMTTLSSEFLRHKEELLGCDPIVVDEFSEVPPS